MSPDVAERLARRRQEQERDPCAISEDPAVGDTALFKEIQGMIENGKGSRLLKGREG